MVVNDIAFLVTAAFILSFSIAAGGGAYSITRMLREVNRFRVGRLSLFNGPGAIYRQHKELYPESYIRRLFDFCWMLGILSNIFVLFVVISDLLKRVWP